MVVVLLVVGRVGVVVVAASSTAVVVAAIVAEGSGSGSAARFRLVRVVIPVAGTTKWNIWNKEHKDNIFASLLVLDPALGLGPLLGGLPELDDEAEAEEAHGDQDGDDDGRRDARLLSVVLRLGYK